MHFCREDVRWEVLHFNEKTGQTITAPLSKPRLRNDAVPSLFPNCPAYMSSVSNVRESPESKKARIEEKAFHTAMVDSIATHNAYKENRHFCGLNDLTDRKLGFTDSSYWTVIRKEKYLHICRISEPPLNQVPMSLVISDDCSIRAFVHEVEVKKLGNYKIPSKIDNINELEVILNNLRNIDVNNCSTKSDSTILILQLVISLLTAILDEDYKHFPALKFVCEQLRLMTLKKVVYSSEFTIFSSLLYNCSPQGYRLLRDSGYVIFPSFSTLKRVFVSKDFSPSLEQHDENFLVYIKQKFKSLSDNDKIVNLLIDEIHLKAYFDYKGGDIVGSAFDSCEAANSAFVFMLNSIRSTFKDVVHIIPTKCMKAETLHSIIKKVILGLEKIGFTILCIITDNNAINGKAMSYFANPPKLSIVYKNPFDKTRPLFFMFDSVHLLKCIRNNWIGQKDTEKTMRYPKFSYSGKYFENEIEMNDAPLSTLQKLFWLERTSLLSHSYKLTQKALWPSSLERQNVNLVLKVFNEYVIEALLNFGKKKCLPFSSEVAGYIKVIHIWWTIMNVKSKFAGKRLNNKFATPLTNDSEDLKYEFLDNFYLWLQVWDENKATNGNLTRETFTALKHTTHAIIELTDYCISELKMDYILTGKFQTDNLEERFSKYRQLSGGNYNISIRQVFESEKKLRMMSVLKKTLSLNGKSVNLSEFEEIKWDEMSHEEQVNLDDFDVNVSHQDFDECKGVIPIIVYLAGYCCYSVDKKIKCKFCKQLTTHASNEEFSHDYYSYIDSVSRGSLLRPSAITVNIIMYNYIILSKITKMKIFLKAKNQRNIALVLTMKTLTENDARFETDVCDAGHSTEKVEKMLLWASTNSLLNNFCRKENDLLACGKSEGKKRKLQTLTSDSK